MVRPSSRVSRLTLLVTAGLDEWSSPCGLVRQVTRYKTRLMACSNIPLGSEPAKHYMDKPGTNPANYLKSKDRNNWRKVYPAQKRHKPSKWAQQGFAESIDGLHYGISRVRADP